MLGYVHADIVEQACVRIPTTRDAIGPDGNLTNPASRKDIAAMLSVLISHLQGHDTNS